MRYHLVQHQYECPLCKSTEFSEIVEEIEEVLYPEFYDDNGNIHYHDYNCGETSLLCKNGHSSIVPYISACECGWNLEANSRETFENSKAVPTLFDSDSE